MKAKRPFSKDPYHQIMSPKSSVTLPEGDSVQSWPILAGGADFVRSHVPRVRTSSCACTLFTSNAIHISPQSASRQSSRRYFLAQACSLHWWDRPINQLTLSVCVISVRPLIIAVRESSSLSPSLSRRHVPLLAPLSSLEGSYDYSYVTLECILIEYRWRAENVYNIHMCCRSKSRRRCNVYIYIYTCTDLEEGQESRYVRAYTRAELVPNDTHIRVAIDTARRIHTLQTCRVSVTHKENCLYLTTDVPMHYMHSSLNI